jgi:hypothetical protein
MGGGGGGGFKFASKKFSNRDESNEVSLIIVALVVTSVPANYTLTAKVRQLAQNNGKSFRQLIESETDFNIYTGIDAVRPLTTIMVWS